MSAAWEINNRRRKALAILDAAASAFDGHGIPLAELEEFTPEMWSMLTAVAGEQKGRRFGDPSDQCIELVLSSARVREADKARAPDPFAGLSR